MDSSVARQISRDEHWKISCHEAGHAIVGVRLELPLERVLRGEGEKGEVEPAINPIEEPDGDWTPEQISQWRQFYAAGAAAEILLFGRYREYGSRDDRDTHDFLEETWQPNRTHGWDRDIQAALDILDRHSIENVARELDRRGELSEDQVRELLGLAPL
jgi:hypothetical protein